MSEEIKNLEQILQEVYDGWPGAIGEERKINVKALIDRVTKEYSKAFDMSENEVLELMEKNRNVNCVNWYQDSNFPKLEDIRIFKSVEELRASIGEMKFQCPCCLGTSTNPNVCNSGVKKDKKICDWKSYGLFGTLGKGFRFAVIEEFKNGQGFLHEIFMPLSIINTSNGQ